MFDCPLHIEFVLSIVHRVADGDLPQPLHPIFNNRCHTVKTARRHFGGILPMRYTAPRARSRIAHGVQRLQRAVDETL